MAWLGRAAGATLNALAPRQLIAELTQGWAVVRAGRGLVLVGG
jgi:hypothetical protein